MNLFAVKNAASKNEQKTSASGKTGPKIYVPLKKNVPCVAIPRTRLVKNLNYLLLNGDICHTLIILSKGLTPIRKNRNLDY